MPFSRIDDARIPMKLTKKQDIPIYDMVKTCINPIKQLQKQEELCNIYISVYTNLS